MIATVTQFQAALHATEIDLGSGDLVQPINRTVISRNVRNWPDGRGRRSTPLSSVTTDLTVIHVDANVSENDISQVKPRDKVSLAVEAYPNRPFAGEVIQIGRSPRTIQNITTYDIVISAPIPIFC